MKHHILEFFSEPCIGCIIGTNGYIWIEAPRRKVEKGQETAPVTLAERQRIAALRNAIIMLDKQSLPIYKETILKVIESQQISKIEPRDMLANTEILIEGAMELVASEVNQS